MPGTFDKEDLNRRMNGSIAALRGEFAGLRTGRANPALLDPVTVEAYGNPMPVTQLGTVSAPEPRLLTVQVWDKSMVKSVDKAIRDAGLGLIPGDDEARLGAGSRSPVIEAESLCAQGGLACRAKIQEQFVGFHRV